MPTHSAQPRILIITPEAAFVPAGLVNLCHCQRTLKSGFVALLSKLVSDLCDRGVDVHVAQSITAEFMPTLPLKKAIWQTANCLLIGFIWLKTGSFFIQTLFIPIMTGKILKKDHS
jgi:hypothetical protein